MVETFRPESLEEALSIRAAHSVIPFAGGTDLMVKYRAKNGMDPPLPGPVMFVDTVPELLGAKLQSGPVSGCPDGALILGASLPIAVIADDAGERAAFAAGPAGSAGPDVLNAIPAVLKEAAADLGAPALRQRAVLAGNVANASPAGDTVAALHALDARVILVSTERERILSLDEFITGPGKTELAEDELIKAILIPRPLPDWDYWRKVGTRRANALTKVSLAAAACTDGQRVVSFRMAFGAVGPIVIRPAEAESLISGRDAGGLDTDELKRAIAPHINPIDDQRSTARYRKTVALNLIGDALQSLAAKLKENNT